MSFFSRLFKRRGVPVKQSQLEKPADQSAPPRNSTDSLTEIRHQARTGDPTLSGKHRSGTF